MVLQALVACAEVTLRAVATAVDIPVRGGVIRAEGDLDFRGTLAVDRSTPVGFSAIRLKFELESDASPVQVETLLGLTRSEEHTPELQSLMRRPYAVFCWKKKNR